MLDVFIGQHENKIDGKARLSIPAHFRKVIERGHKDREPGSPPSFLLVFGDERTDYLEGMTITTYDKIARKIRKLPKGDPRRQDLSRTIFGNAQPLVLDETGRIVMPGQGRDKLGLQANDMVSFTGNGDTFFVRKAEAAARIAEQRPAADPSVGYDPRKNPMDYLDGDDDDDDED